MKKNRRLRILDANSNRCREGARVLEDICRFALENSSLASRWKEARHMVTGILRGADGSMADSRDSGSDPGRMPAWDSGKVRGGFCDIAAANAKRVAEGLRVLEEFTRMVSPGSGGRLKELRFEVYGLEKETLSELRKLKEEDADN